MSSTRTTLHGAVAVITIDNAPVNGLGLALRTSLVATIDAANADSSVRVIMVTGANGVFSGGADIREFGTPRMTAEPGLHTLIHVAESSPKPVVAAINGTCMGGGLELSLGCHFRVAAVGAQIALPEVKLGLLPGAGGTQRLPRAIGVERALEMIVSGAPVNAERFEGTALFDEIIEGDFMAGALAFARRMVAAQRSPKRLRDVSPQAPADGFFASARSAAGATSLHFPAPLKCIDAVAASVELPFDEGMAAERSMFVQLLASPESRALRHAFFGERAAARIPDVPADTPTRPVERVAVIGAGTMGSGITMNFLNVGIPVVLMEMSQEALDRGLGAIRRNYENAVKKGRMTPEAMERALGLVHGTLSYDDSATVDLVIEAVFEEMQVKRAVFTMLDAVMKPGAILATNTSTLNVNTIAGFTSRPQDVVGLHFFSPANVMKLLEVVRGARTGKDVLATVLRVAKKIRKTAVVSGVCDGFIGNRMVEQYVRQALFLVEEGASPQQVDRALETFGMAMGPFRMSDLAGNDIGWAIRKRRAVEQPGVTYSRIADSLCELGRFGQKTGAGWYRYEPGQREAVPDAAVDRLIDAHRAERGIVPREIGDAEVVDRCVFALVNEGARILEEGIAARASDIDIVYLTGYGFPSYRGGPMLHADMTGLANVSQAMSRFAASSDGGGDAAFWTPAPLLDQLVAEGRSFTD